jgi:hypothetical protein
MEAYRALFRCEYPEIYEFAFGFETRPGEPLFDETSTHRLYNALKEYREAEKRLKEAERLGREAMFFLAEKRPFDRFLLLWLVLRRDPNREFHFYAPGVPRRIAPYLAILNEQYYKVFRRFPEKVARRIDWEKLEFIKPSSVESIIHRRIRPLLELEYSGEAYREYKEKVTELGEARDNLSSYKREAESAIENILQIVWNYENRWFVP